jgi:FKBP-type peptidyl-prolyl cis-trans isomerase
MTIASGIKLLEEREGDGRPAGKGDRVVFNLKIFLNRGDEVPMNALQSEEAPAHRMRVEGDDRFVDHIIVLGKRQAMAAVETALIGMKAGGYRKVRASPHLAYREKGIPGLIPENAVLILEIWLRELSAGG